MSRIWAGTDCGKTHHHTLVLDAEGETLLPGRVANDGSEPVQLVGDVLDLADGRDVTWALDMAGGGPGLLVNHGQELVCIPGIAVNRASDSYRGAGKTDARDARVLADQARMRRDLQPIRPGDDAGIELKLLTERRVDPAADRTRTTNRLKGLPNSMFPGLERTLGIGTTGALPMLTGYQTPAAIRRTGLRRLTTWLGNRKARNPEALATRAVEAAERQHTAVAGETAIAKTVHTLTKEVTALNEKIAETDKLIEGRFREHELAEVIQSVPGIRAVLGAELLGGIGGSLDAFPTPDRLAAFAGATPAPRGSGKAVGALQRPQRCHRRLQRVFCTSALVSIRFDPNSRKFYDRKRAEGKRPVQAVLALALVRRRVNVPWALIRDRRCYQVTPPVTTAA